MHPYSKIRITKIKPVGQKENITWLYRLKFCVCLTTMGRFSDIGSVRECLQGHSFPLHITFDKTPNEEMRKMKKKCARNIHSQITILYNYSNSILNLKTFNITMYSKFYLLFLFNLFHSCDDSTYALLFLVRYTHVMNPPAGLWNPPHLSSTRMSFIS